MSRLWASTCTATPSFPAYTFVFFLESLSRRQFFFFLVALLPAPSPSSISCLSHFLSFLIFAPSSSSLPPIYLNHHAQTRPQALMNNTLCLARNMVPLFFTKKLQNVPCKYSQTVCSKHSRQPRHLSCKESNEPMNEEQNKNKQMQTTTPIVKCSATNMFWFPCAAIIGATKKPLLAVPMTPG